MGRIGFQYRALHDVVIAHVDWTLDTEADVVAWFGESIEEALQALLDDRAKAQ